MKHSIILLLLIIFVACSPQPPIAKKIHYEETHHETLVKDNYHWMKDKSRSKEDVLEYIKSENEYTKKMMDHTRPLRQKLYDEIVARSDENEVSVPIRNGKYYYYWERNKEQDYFNYCRKEDYDSSQTEVLLDVNKLAKQFNYYDVMDVQMSPDEYYLSFLADTTGAESYTMYIKEVDSGKIFPEHPHNIGDITWANDNKTIFYTTEDISGRTNKIYRHHIGDKTENDEMIFEEKDGKFYAWTERTRSNKYILIGTASKTTSEIWFLNADTPDGDFSLVEPRKTGQEYYIDHVGNEFCITTNADNAFNFKLARTKVKHPQKKYWKDFIAHRDSVEIRADIFENYIALYERINGIRQLRVINFDQTIEKMIDFPEKSYSLYSYRNPEFSPDFYYFSYESFISTRTIYKLDFDDFKLSIAQQKKNPADFNREDFVTEVHYARSNDGTKVPISLVYKKNLSLPAPILLTAYGSYGDSSDPYFSKSRISLINRDIIYGIAHVRGGGEFGKKWYDTGRLLHKKNTFQDFISCSEFLLEEGYTTTDKFVIEGGSAGGLLIGAVINNRPDLYHAAIADVPFVDVLNTMFDPTLSAVESEYEEWGNPNEKLYFDYIRSYCPYQNVSSQAYPNLLILAGFNDPRVNYWEPLKWTAKLRDMKTDDNLLLLHIDMNSGHGGASGKFGYIKQLAFEYAFILDVLGR